MKRQRLFFSSLLIVALLVGGCGRWVWQAKRQYTLNRQLIDALVNNDTKQALVLVNAGANPNTRYYRFSSLTLRLLLEQLLHRSSVSADNSPTAFMIECGAFYKQPETAYDPQLRYEGNPQLIEAMLTHGADVHLHYVFKYTALRGAVCRGNPQIVELLLKKGANVNEQYDEGRTPLMESVNYHDRNIVRLLLEYGAKVNVQDREGRTPLHFAILFAMDKSMIVQLLAHRADLHISDNNGYTALTLAQQQNHPDIVAFLRRYTK